MTRSRAFWAVGLQSPRSRRRRRSLPLLAGCVSTALVLLGASAASGSPVPTASHPGPAGPSLQDRTVNVLNAPYNAAGDGSANDRPAIQQAIDDVAGLGGGTVVLPADHTFVSGNLTLGNNVTLEIDGTLKQSQDAADYTYTPLLGRTAQGCPTCAFYNTWFFNYPLIYAGEKHDIAVTGSGTILSTEAPGGQSSSIIVVAIGLYNVTRFVVQDIHILDSNAYNVTAWDSTFGLVKDVVINAVQANTDGINVKNSQHVRITGNTIDNRDDGIIIGSGYNDPRAGTWWQSNAPRGGSQDIEIDHNVDRLHPINPNPVGKAIAFIPWGTTAPDARSTELKDIYIHDNYLQAPMSVGCWCDNPYNQVKSNTDHSAIKHVRIVNNQYINYDGTSPSHLDWIQYARITDLVDDFGKPSYPTFLNPGFEQTGTAYWSTEGDAGAAQKTDPSTGPHSAAARRAAAGFADGDWYGYIEGAADDAAIYEGLGLDDAIRYHLEARLLNSDLSVKMFVLNTCTGQTVAQRTVSSGSPQTTTLDFTAQGTCGDYHVGFTLAGQGGDGWALVDDADLAIADSVIDDTQPAFTYSSGWSTVGLPNTIEDRYHLATAAGATATISFTGSRAFLYGLRRWNDGQADVYIDGNYQGRIDTYNLAFVDHQVLFDTGSIAEGPHTLQIVATGTHNSDSTGNQIQLDALVVKP